MMLVSVLSNHWIQRLALPHHYKYKHHTYYSIAGCNIWTVCPWSSIKKIVTIYVRMQIKWWFSYAHSLKIFVNSFSNIESPHVRTIQCGNIQKLQNMSGTYQNWPTVEKITACGIVCRKNHEVIALTYVANCLPFAMRFHMLQVVEQSQVPWYVRRHDDHVMCLHILHSHILIAPWEMWP